MEVESENLDLMPHYAASDLGLCYYFLDNEQLCDILSEPLSTYLLALCLCEQQRLCQDCAGLSEPLRFANVISIKIS